MGNDNLQTEPVIMLIKNERGFCCGNLKKIAIVFADPNQCFRNQIELHCLDSLDPGSLQLS